MKSIIAFTLALMLWSSAWADRPKFGHLNVSDPPYSNMALEDWILVFEDTYEPVNLYFVVSEVDDNEGWFKFIGFKTAEGIVSIVGEIRERKLRLIYTGEDIRFLRYRLPEPDTSI